MSSTTHNGFVAAATLLAVSTAAIAGSGSGSQDYDARIEKLERELAQLREDRTEVRSEEVRMLVGEALADAEMRSSLLQSGMVAGWDDGFMLGNSTGDYTLRISGQLQTRFVANIRDDSGDDDTEYGFETRRAKLAFAGNVVDPSWRYKVKGAFERDGDDGNFQLEDAYVEKQLDSFTIRFGQFKPAYLREENVSSTRQLAVERSLVNERYNQDWVQGVQVAWGQDNLKFSAALHDGFRSRNTAAVDQQSEFAISGRADLLLAGTWEQFDDFAGWRGQEYGVRVGAGFSFDKDAYGTAAMNEAETTGFTIDTQVEGDGWNFFGAFVYQSVDTAVTPSADEMAFVVQGGYFVTDNTEIFARYEWGDDDVNDGFQDLSVITVGANHYLASHGAKLSLDVLFGLDPVGGEYVSGGAGVQADAANQDGQIAVRGQFQLLF